MKQVIVLRGTGNVGKSTSIKLAYAALLKKHPTIRFIEPPAETRKEIRVVIRIGRTRIGIESRGDTRWFIDQALKLFIDT